MEANLYITSEIVDGALVHPTLPMSYLGEVVDIPGENYAPEYAYSFRTTRSYDNPFFILTNDIGLYFYYSVSGSGDSFQIYFMRGFRMMEGRYKYYSGESGNQITRPMLLNGKLYVGGARG